MSNSLDVFAIPPETWQHAFSFLDAKSHYNITLTCSWWCELASHYTVWDAMCTSSPVHFLFLDFYPQGESLREVLPKDLLASLPSEDEYATFDAREDEWSLDREKKTPSSELYRRAMTTVLVCPEGMKEDDVKKLEDIFAQPIPDHASLRSKRVFTTVQDAMDFVAPHDIIYLASGDFDGPPLSLSKPVVLFGTIKRRYQGQRYTNVLHSVLKSPIKVQGFTGQAEIFGLCLQGAGYIDVTNSALIGRRIIFGANDGRVVLNKGADVALRNCSFIGNDGSITIVSPEFKSLRMEAMSFDENFNLDDLMAIHKRLLEALKANEEDYVIAGLVTSLVAPVSPFPFVRNFIIASFYQLLNSILERYYANRTIVLASLKAMHRLSILRDSKINAALSQVNFLPVIEKIIQTLEDDAQVQFIVCAVCWWLVNTPEYRHHFRETRLWHLEMELLKKYTHNADVAYKITSLFWHGSHHLEPVKPILLQSVPTICEVMDNFPDNEVLQLEASGSMWNFPHEWPHDLVVMVLPRVLHAVRVCRDSESIDSILGFFAKLLGSCEDDDLNFLVEKDAISLFFELIKKYDNQNLDPGARESKTVSHIWKIISTMTKHPRARDLLAEKISKSRKFSLLTDSQMVSIARLLTRQPQVSDAVYRALSKALRKFENSNDFFIAMDALVSLHENKTAVLDKEKLAELDTIFFAKSEKFLSNSHFSDWYPWACAHIKKEPIAYSSYHVDLENSPEMHVATDGLTCRHDVQGFFGTAIGIKAVSKGKWYYELQLLNDNLYQVGWVNDQFVARPQEGRGVGDCANSWAIDLYRNAKWHELEDGLTSRLPYGVEYHWHAGGVIGCLLDLDTRVMSHTYNGKSLGVSFSNFKIGRGLRPAFSTHLQQEARFNFGTKPFHYPPPPDYTPIAVAYFQ